MTITAVQKAVIDRGIVIIDISAVERKINSHAATALDLSTVEAYLDTVVKIRKALTDVHSRIAYQAPTDLADHEAEYTAINERITTSKIKLMDIKRSLTPPASSSAPTPAHVKLPDMQLPSFEGRFEEWPSFDDLFQATIGKSSSLSRAQKLQYLKSCVKGDAYNLIKSFVITDSNYDEAWALLSNRYNNQSEIVYSLCKKILYQSHLKSESVTSLQQLLNSTTEAIRSLRVMGQPTDKWDSLLVVSTIEKLDPDTKSAWARTRTGTTPAIFKEVTDFLELHIRSLNAKGVLTTKVTTTATNSKGNSTTANKARTYHISSAPATCPLCKGSHQLYQCPKLLEMDGSQRMSAVKKTTACLNCLRDGHPVKRCSSTHTCKHCSRKHHTLLHSNDANVNMPQSQENNSSASSSQRVVTTNISSASSSSSQRVFKTALVDIEDSQGIKRQCRVLFDDCSEAEYITQSCAKALGLPTRKEDVLVEGVGQVKVARVKSSASATLYSRVSKESIFVDNMLVLPRLSGYIPRLPCDSQEWTHIHGLPLADPSYDKPGEIDILLGTGVVSYLMKDGISRGTPNQPVAYNSSFGWVLSGIMNSQPLRVVRTHHTTCKLEELVQRFWEVEQMPLKKPFTTEEQAAESHFMETHSRKPDGRFVVRLPFNEKKLAIGETRELALRRLFQLEKRFKKFPDIQKQYIQFMREYRELGHMEPVSQSAAEKKKVFIPHHFVQKEDSTTTKLRVVFDASMKSTSGVSLNDALMVGPTIQDDLYTQTNRFRTHIIALKADIAKMYRQFEIHPDEWNYQIILWRETEDEPVQEYCLKTVTYGTACAPFLATRCLDQLATDEKEKYPIAASVIKSMMYIDDLLGGQRSREDSLRLFDDLSNLCKLGGLDIRKWCSSDPDVLQAIPDEMQEQALVHDFDEDTTVKALGIRWRPQGDYFYFHVEKKTPKDIITKREVLSEIARTFDPIGWLTPTTVVAKILFQDLWKETADWDAQVSEEIRARWNTYCQDLQVISDIQIPRLIIPEQPVDIQIHCFADSSEKSMACALYLRCVKKDGEIISHLITSKSRIAPIKQLSIPRLELNAAVLLVETFEAVVKSYNFQYTVYAWTDSMITLSWLTLSSRRWKTYVATRVATIQEIIPARCWNHVRSNDNPADLPSRGISPQELVNSAIWWHGPPWLISNQFPISHATLNEEEVANEERTTKTTLFISSAQDSLADILIQVSSLSKAVTRTAWLRRFIAFLKCKQKCPIGPLCPTERRQALQVLIKNVQQQHFSEEVAALSNDKQLSSKSKLRQLNPFIDSSGVIRVGGRIGNAQVSSAFKYPVLLPHQHHFTYLIIRHSSWRIYTHIINAKKTILDSSREGHCSSSYSEMRNL